MALTDLLHDAAATTPDREAVRFRGATLSYAELESRSAALAASLADAGVEPGDRVGMLLPKSLDAVVAVYGIMRRGAAYVPLDVHAPPARSATIALDCGVRAVVVASRDTATKVLDAFPDGASRPRVVAATAGSTPRRATEVRPDGDDLAYLLYTSGSTGAPKGVMLTHANAMAFVEWAASTLGVASGDTVAGHAPFHFDLSVFDLYVTALAGAGLVLVPDDEAYLGMSLAQFARASGATVWYSVPSALMLLVRSARGDDLATLRTVAFAGEAYPTPRLRELRAAAPEAALWNLYGPTETNVVTYHHVESIPADDEPIPIGRACEHATLSVVKDDGTPAADDETGELHVAGPSVMRGYWNRPNETAHAFGGDPATRVYRTGDFVRRRPDGVFEFCGRRDHQIKTRGYRVELAEVEVALTSHPLVAEAAPVALPHATWGSEIVAAAVPVHPGAVTPLDVRRHVGARVPRHMVPVRVELLPALPRTSTGKVDRVALAGILAGEGVDGEGDADAGR